jgi:hypothetical protein
VKASDGLAAAQSENDSQLRRARWDAKRTHVWTSIVCSFLEIVLQQMDHAKGDVNLNRLIDESLLDELEKDGFFKQLQKQYPQR